MLKSLTVNNYALIKEIRFLPETGLNVVTGETGAGKSILLGALGFVLGNRADTTVLLPKSEKCIVEAIFLNFPQKVVDFLQNHELDIEPELILRREISAAGKSRAFINDTPVAQNQLKELGEFLVEIHTQNTGLLIRDNNEQLSLLDTYGGNIDLLQEYSKLWNHYIKERQKLTELQELATKATGEYDYLKFQFEELETFKPTDGEETYLEQRANMLNHASDIAEAGNTAWNMLSENENSIYSQLSAVRSVIKGVANISPELDALYARIDSIMLDIRDVSQEIGKISETSQPDNAELERINERLALLQMLLKKHRRTGAAELKQLLEELNEKIYAFDHSEEAMQKQVNLVAEAHKNCILVAQKLHAAREHAAKKLGPEAQLHLAKLGMPKAGLQVELGFDENKLGAKGGSAVVLLFNANDSRLLPLDKVASGGEVSRLNFVFKALLADKKEMPTIIFDEADTGVSGEVADRFGEMMKELSAYHQIIAITHLPQVAAKGNAHFLIYKGEEDGKMVSALKHLNPENRIDALANMLSGKTPGTAAVANARELLGLN